MSPSSPSPPAVAELARRAAPVSAAGERVLPVAPALEPLVAPGLKRGSVVVVAGASSLALALLAEPSARGFWCAAVGFPAEGMAAAAELGVALERFPLVPAPPSSGPRGWAWVVASLLAGVDAVVAWPPAHLPAQAARQLSDRARHSGSVLVVRGAWPGPADLHLEVARTCWVGLGQGHGLLSARRAEVVARGRGRAARERRAEIWLPSARGGLESAGPVGPMQAVASDDRRAG